MAMTDTSIDITPEPELLREQVARFIEREVMRDEVAKRY
jgi:hypothetical protein